MNIKELLRIYKNIAVIGVTTDEEKFGFKVFKRLLDLNYHVYGISPKYKEVLNEKMYTSLEDIQGPIDIVVFVVNKKFAMNYINEMRNIGVKYAWMQPNTYDDELLDYMNTIGITPIKACILVETKDF